MFHPSLFEKSLPRVLPVRDALGEKLFVALGYVSL
jgi:hypothetical protein